MAAKYKYCNLLKHFIGIRIAYIGITCVYNVTGTNEKKVPQTKNIQVIIDVKKQIQLPNVKY